MKIIKSIQELNQDYNHDNLYEIFLRLPATSLLRFQCVCKYWSSVISDSAFRIEHSRFQKFLYPNPNAILLQDFSSHAFQLIPIKDNKKVPFFTYLGVSEIKIESSCNGLLLLSSSSIQKYFVCNPTTKEFKVLAPFPSNIVPYAACSLAYDPSISPHYKVICIHQDNVPFVIAVYSSERGSWITLKTAPPLTLSYKGEVFCNGAMHWYCYHKTTCYLDVHNEILSFMPMPPPYSSTDATAVFPDVVYFGESRGNLTMALAKDFSPAKFDVFQMQCDRSRWCLTYTVNLDSVKSEFPSIFWLYAKYSLLSIIESEEEEDKTLIMCMNGGAVSVSIHGDRMKRICELQSRTVKEGWDYRYHESRKYFESLACP